jgi:hypothetical protein
MSSAPAPVHFKSRYGENTFLKQIFFSHLDCFPSVSLSGIQILRFLLRPEYCFDVIFHRHSYYLYISIKFGRNSRPEGYRLKSEKKLNERCTRCNLHNDYLVHGWKYRALTDLLETMPKTAHVRTHAPSQLPIKIWYANRRAKRIMCRSLVKDANHRAATSRNIT